MKRPAAALLLAAALLSAPAPLARADTPAPRRPNILFIAVDDLRTELGCYGKKPIQSPNIDRLAARGILFEHAYCMFSICGASRASLLTGIRPKHDRITRTTVFASKELPDAIPINTHFKNHGYATLNNGKVFHDPADHNDGWDEPAWRPLSRHYATPEALRIKEEVRAHSKATGRLVNGQPWVRGPIFETADAPDSHYPDGQTLEKSLTDLRRLAQGGKPFFLAVGFIKPHLPFTAPKKYWDLYRDEDIRFPENYRYAPAGAPDLALHNSPELRTYAGFPQGTNAIPDDQARTLIRGYYMSVSFMDAQVGRLLDELDALNLTDNTAVVLFGDHGWQLGEHTLWSKQTVFEHAMNAPLIIRLPGQKAPIRFSKPVEFIDIYPTLNALAGLPEPKPGQLQGKNLIPLAEGKTAPGKLYAAGRYETGDTIFDGRYRYSEFRDKKGAGKLLARMLYDHQTDPRENTNIVDRAENAATAETLAAELNRIKELP
jgi:arylsulfatase A-like enzyme